MSRPAWLTFRNVWWVVITALTAIFFCTRISAIAGGASAPVDVFIFLVLVALLLAPIFKEVSFFGLKFKQAIDDLQKQISTQLSVFKAELQTTIVSSNNVNVNFPPSPPPDDQLPGLETRIRGIVTDFLREEDIPVRQRTEPEAFEVDANTEFLFRARHAIEKKLRHIASQYADLPERGAIPIGRLTSVLVRQELLNANLAGAIREIYSVCSPAIHGDTVTKAQIDFVKDVAPQVIDTLSEIERRTTGPTIFAHERRTADKGLFCRNVCSWDFG
jgi:hypothetical protein